MLEVDVDIGRLTTLPGHEALEQQFVLNRVDRGDAEDKADAGVGGRAAALTEDTAPACFADDRVDSQEVRRVAKLADQPHLMRDLVSVGLGHVAIEHPVDSLVCQALQRFVRGQPVDQLLMRVLILKLAKIEGADPRDVDARLQCVGIGAEAPDHLVGRFQRAIGVHLAAIAKLVDGAFLAHRRDHVLQQPRFRRVVEYIAGNDGAHAGTARLAGKRIDPDRVSRPAPLEQRHVAAPPVDRLQVPQRRKVILVRLVRQQDRDNALGPWFEIVPVKEATALPCPRLTNRQQTRNPRPRRPVGGVEQQATAAG